MAAAPHLDPDIPNPDGDLAAAFFAAIAPPGTVMEMRIPKPKKGGPRRLFGVTSGYFDNAPSFAAAAQSVTPLDAEAVYVTINPVAPVLIARATNRLKDGNPSTTSDAQIVARRHLFFDIDPVYEANASGISASDQERRAALQKRDQTRAFLEEDLGWPDPLYCGSSGNGGAILYRFDAPNTDEITSIVRSALAAVDALLSDDTAKIDTTAYNPSRIAKIPGTVSAKGDHVPGRPYRLATGEVTHDAEPVTIDQVKALAALLPDPEPKGKTAAPNASGTPSGEPGNRQWTIADALRTSGVGFTEKQRGGSTVFALDRCLTSDDHTDGACVIERHNGLLLYVCHHTRCQGKTWHDARARLRVPEPARVNTPPKPSAPSGPDIDAPSAPAPSKPRDTWPARMAPEAFHGLPGEVVRAIAPHTEGDEAAILMNYLVMFGAAVGRTPHCQVSGRRHHANENVVLVGATSKGRKGSAHDYPLWIVGDADPDWRQRVMGGLSSGEGLVWQIRDQVWGTNKKGESVVVDQGIDDKRLLAVEEEYASVCKVATRDGNTVTETIRRAWDGQALGALTKNSVARCQSPHVSIIGHVTRDELLRVMDDSAAGNGFGNRFLWIAVRRSRLLPEGGNLTPAEAEPLIDRTRDALSAARRIGLVARDDETKALWADVYAALSEPSVGLFGAMTDRAEPHVLRLSLIYALLDGSHHIRKEHLLAALAVWDYAAASAKHIFGDALGDQVADRILTGLRQNGPMDQTEISELFGRNVGAARLSKALKLLLSAGRATSKREAPEGRGRPKTVWQAIG